MAPKRCQVNVGGIPVTIFSNMNKSEQSYQRMHGLFLLHGRLQTIEHYASFAESLVSTRSDLLVFVFEQRNHGSRLIDDTANQTWRDGNLTHAFDMWSVQYGTACDVSFLITSLPFFLETPSHDHDGSISSLRWHEESVVIESWSVCGISLGGHATLLALAHDDRISMGISVIGCGDYLALMTDRASKSKETIPLPPVSYEFMNQALLNTLKIHDPVHRILHFKGKALLLLQGELDRLVPAATNTQFIEALKQNAYCNQDDQESLFQVVIEPGAKHEFTDAMKQKSIEFIQRHLRTL